MMRLLVILLVVLAGCMPLRRHRDKNAPGIIDVDAAPTKNEPGRIEPPNDPGEDFATFNPGIFGGGGYSDGGAALLGVEVSVNRGSAPRSHHKDGFFVYPVDGYGVSLGWDLVRYRNSDFDLGPLYLEYQRFSVFLGGSIGYSIDPDDLDHGPQVSAWAGPWFVRGRYGFGGTGIEIFSGIQIKIPVVTITSR